MGIIEIKEEIKSILDNVLRPQGVPVYWIEKIDNASNKYVVFNIISTPYICYANNKPTLRRYNVDVKYFAPKNSLNKNHINLIQEAMLSKGWGVFTPDMAVSTATKDKIVGIVIEFAKEQVVI